MKTRDADYIFGNRKDRVKRRLQKNNNTECRVRLKFIYCNQKNVFWNLNTKISIIQKMSSFSIISAAYFLETEHMTMINFKVQVIRRKIGVIGGRSQLQGPHSLEADQVEAGEVLKLKEESVSAARIYLCSQYSYALSPLRPRGSITFNCFYPFWQI